ncbi:MAG: hypothetical protein V1902_00175 [Candidatus Falkowbacteria bacterium]
MSLRRLRRNGQAWQYAGKIVSKKRRGVMADGDGKAVKCNSCVDDLRKLFQSQQVSRQDKVCFVVGLLLMCVVTTLLWRGSGLVETLCWFGVLCVACGGCLPACFHVWDARIIGIVLYVGRGKDGEIHVHKTMPQQLGEHYFWSANVDAKELGDQHVFAPVFKLRLGSVFNSSIVVGGFQKNDPCAVGLGRAWLWWHGSSIDVEMSYGGQGSKVVLGALRVERAFKLYDYLVQQRPGSIGWCIGELRDTLLEVVEQCTNHEAIAKNALCKLTRCKQALAKCAVQRNALMLRVQRIVMLLAASKAIEKSHTSAAARQMLENALVLVIGNELSGVGNYNQDMFPGREKDTDLNTAVDNLLRGMMQYPEVFKRIPGETSIDSVVDALARVIAEQEYEFQRTIMVRIDKGTGTEKMDLGTGNKP